MESSNYSNDYNDNAPFIQVGSSYIGISEESSRSQYSSEPTNQSFSDIFITISNSHIEDIST